MERREMVMWGRVLLVAVLFGLLLIAAALSSCDEAYSQGGSYADLMPGDSIAPASADYVPVIETGATYWGSGVSIDADTVAFGASEWIEIAVDMSRFRAYRAKLSGTAAVTAGTLTAYWVTDAGSVADSAHAQLTSVSASGAFAAEYYVTGADTRLRFETGGSGNLSVHSVAVQVYADRYWLLRAMHGDAYVSVYPLIAGTDSTETDTIAQDTHWIGECGKIAVGSGSPGGIHAVR